MAVVVAVAVPVPIVPSAASQSCHQACRCPRSCPRALHSWDLPVAHPSLCVRFTSQHIVPAATLPVSEKNHGGAHLLAQTPQTHRPPQRLACSADFAPLLELNRTDEWLTASLTTAIWGARPSDANALIASFLLRAPLLVPHRAPYCLARYHSVKLIFRSRSRLLNVMCMRHQPGAWWARHKNTMADLVLYDPATPISLSCRRKVWAEP